MNRSLTLIVTSAFKRIAAISRMTVLLSLAAAGLFLSACESPEERAAGYLDSAQVLYDADDLVKAEIDVKNALQIQPKNSRARYLLAEINEQRRGIGIKVHCASLYRNSCSFQRLTYAWFLQFYSIFITLLDGFRYNTSDN